MKTRIYTMRDAAVQGFERPVMFRTDAEAIRAVDQTLKTGNSHLNQSPADYSLWYVGEFDGETGEIKPVSPECVLTSQSMVNMAEIVERNGNDGE